MSEFSRRSKIKLVGSLSLALLMFAPVANAAKAKAKEKRTPAQQEWCHGERWPLSRDLTIEQISAQISTQPRLFLTQLLWSEIELGDSKNLIAPLSKFLAGTEQDSQLRGYYKAMGYLAQNGVSVDETIKTWPKRAPLAKERMPLKEMCDHFAKSGGLGRVPNSITPKKKS